MSLRRIAVALLVGPGLGMLLAIPAPAAQVVVQGFANSSDVAAVLNGAGHSAQVLTSSDIAAQAPALMEADVLVLGPDSTCATLGPLFLAGLQTYVAAGGNVVTGYSGAAPFFSSLAGDSTCSPIAQLGTFGGTLHAGGSHGGPVDLAIPIHPLVDGLTTPMSDGAGTDAMHWIESPDDRLVTVAILTGNGNAGFPNGEVLPVALAGCTQAFGGAFVFGLHDWATTLPGSTVASGFLTRAVDLVANGCDCPMAPATGCFGIAKSVLRVLDSPDDSRDSISFKQSGGGAVVDQAELGDPSMTAVQMLCLYDSLFSEPWLRASLRMDPSASWVSKAPRGWKYKDKTGAEDGVLKASVKAGPRLNQSGLSVTAKGVAVPMPTPNGSSFFHADPVVSVQLHNSETGACWQGDVDEVSRNDGTRFAAKGIFP